MMEMAHPITFGDITEAIAPPLLKISVNGPEMNTKSRWSGRGVYRMRENLGSIKQSGDDPAKV